MSAITTVDNDVKERLSFAFLTAVAARAGCQVIEPRVDRKSIDAVVEPIRGSNVRLDFQLKATSNLTLQGEEYSFDLPVNNYNDLRATDIESSRLLAVIDLSHSSSDWLNVNDECMLLQRSGYWVNLYGSPSTSNTTTIAVKIPRNQLLTPQALSNLMNARFQRLRDGLGGLS